MRDEIKGTYDVQAIEYLARLAEGGLRDALSLLDKCLAYSKELTVENVVQALGVVNYDVFFELAEALSWHNCDAVIRIIERVYADGKDLKQFIRDFMSFLLDVNKYDITHSFEYLQLPNTYEAKLTSEDKAWFATCRDLLPTVVKLSSDIKWDTQPKVIIESKLLGECLK